MRRMLRAAAPLLFSAETLAREVAVLVEARLFTEADAFAGRALHHHRGAPSLLEQHALSAHNSGRYASALERWDRLRTLCPDHVMAWAGVACNLRELGSVDQAAIVVADALRRFPKNAILLGEASRVFATGKVTRLDVERLLHFTPALGDDVLLFEAYTDLVVASAGLEEAGIIINAACDGVADELGWRIALCRLAMRRELWREAVGVAETGLDHPRLAAMAGDALLQLAAQADKGRWGDPARSLADYDFVLARRPDMSRWAARRADTLARLGRLDEAEREVTDLERRFPNEDALLLVRAGLFGKRGSYDEALAFVARYQARHGEDAIAKELHASLLAERSYVSPGGTSMPVLQDVGVERDHAKRELLLRFESLGEDCEFGLVQRRYGAEPVGLFRWNSTRIATLVPALRARLDGIGLPETTRMSTWEGIEYYLADTRWGFGFHTFRTRHEIGFDELYPKMCKRMVFLREKLRDDLRSGEKTFVFKSDDATFEELIALRDALSLDAPCRLLCVKQAARVPVDAGRVVQLAERLYLGAITRFGYREVKWDILFDEWLAICGGLESAPAAPFAPTAI